MTLFRGELIQVKGTFQSTIVTVYQRTPDIAINDVSECLQGHHTRLVFLDLLIVQKQKVTTIVYLENREMYSYTLSTCPAKNQAGGGTS